MCTAGGGGMCERETHTGREGGRERHTEEERGRMKQREGERESERERCIPLFLFQHLIKFLNSEVSSI